MCVCVCAILVRFLLKKTDLFSETMVLHSVDFKLAPLFVEPLCDNLFVYELSPWKTLPYN